MAQMYNEPLVVVRPFVDVLFGTSLPPSFIGWWVFPGRQPRAAGALETFLPAQEALHVTFRCAHSMRPPSVCPPGVGPSSALAWTVAFKGIRTGPGTPH